MLKQALPGMIVFPMQVIVEGILYLSGGDSNGISLLEK
jgi:hypothetical protein